MLKALLAITLAASSLLVRADEKADLNSLLQRSPFGSAADANAQPGDNALELRGVMEDGNELWFSVYEASTKHSTWLTKADTDQAYRINDYDAKTGAIKISYQGRSLTLNLKQAHIQSLPPSLATNGDLPPPAPSATVNAPAAPNPSETQRLAAIAEEIRRRRALRQNQASEAASQNSPAASFEKSP